MLYWWYCWVNFNVIFSLERAKSVKWVWIESEEVLNTTDLDWARFVEYGVFLWPEKLLGCGGCYNVLWVLVTLEMALRVDVVSFLVFLWLIVPTFWQKSWYFTLGGCCGPGSRATIRVIVIRKYFTLVGCYGPRSLYGLATLHWWTALLSAWNEWEFTDWFPVMPPSCLWAGLSLRRLLLQLCGCEGGLSSCCCLTITVWEYFSLGGCCGAEREYFTLR